MKKRTLVILGASSILALGIAAPVAAATSQDHNAKRQQLATALAKELGVEESKVTAALEKLRSEKEPARGEKPAREDLKTRLDKAVQEGKLTQAEADAVLKAAEAGILGPGSGHGRGPGRR